MALLSLTLLALLSSCHATQLSYVKKMYLIPSSEMVFQKSFGPSDLAFSELNGEEVSGGVIKKWAQTYKGEPVFGSILTTHHTKSGLVKKTQGSVMEAIDMEKSDSIISPEAAIDVVRKHWNHSSVNSSLIRQDPAKLFVYPSETGQDFYIYDLSYFIDSPDDPLFIRAMVKASDGSIIDTWNEIQNANIPAIFGNANTGKEIGTLVDVVQNGRNCRHRDTSRRVEVFDVNHREDEWLASSQFLCDDADSETWDTVNGAYSPRNDAYRNAQRFVDMWNRYVGIPPYASSSSYLRFRVHFARNYANAYFDGVQFTIGDGGQGLHPLSSLDIICHEIGHALTSWLFGGLVYRRQSGGINEAYSDIVGETCDMLYQNKNNYLVGDDIGQRRGWYLRDMCEPSRKGSLDNFSQYNDNIDVHYSSGIYNKAWCLLSKTPGWDYIKAFQVFTQANRYYWGSTVTMSNGVCGVESAARDFGLRSADVTRAFRSVGLRCPARPSFA